MTAPLDPVTELETVALNRWPTRCVFVQMREFDASEISEPAGMEPTARSDPDEPFVTVLPLAVVVGAAGAGAGAGRVVVVRGGFLLRALRPRRGRRRRGTRRFLSMDAVAVPADGRTPFAVEDGLDHAEVLRRAERGTVGMTLAGEEETARRPIAHLPAVDLRRLVGLQHPLRRVPSIGVFRVDRVETIDGQRHRHAIRRRIRQAQ